MILYKYKDYDDYVAAQTHANVKKIDLVWVRKQTVETICSYMPDAKMVLCHGTRNGREQQYFKTFLPKAEVIGTEISHTAKQFSMTVQHDFQNPKEEWINKCDIVYSNSFDHASEPTNCLNTWKNQISDNGRLYIEFAFASGHNNSRRSDPLQISENELIELCTDVGLIEDNFFMGNEMSSKVFSFKKSCFPIDTLTK